MFVRFVINVLALLVAWLVVPGIQLSSATPAGKIATIAAVAVIFGVVNALVKPLVTVLSLPAIVLTLGLFLLVVNTLMLMLTGWISGRFGLGFTVDGFWSALLGAIVVSIISGVGTALVREDGGAR